MGSEAEEKRCASCGTKLKKNAKSDWCAKCEREQEGQDDAERQQGGR